MNTKKIVFGALIGAIYAALTIVLCFSSYGVTQFRVSEALTILPFFTSYPILGLVVGCVLSNIISPVGPLDMIFGSLATLIAGFLTYRIGKSNFKFKELLAPLPPVIVNAIVIGMLLYYTANYPLILSMLQVGFGELIICYGLGLPLLLILKKNNRLLNIFNLK